MKLLKNKKLRIFVIVCAVLLILTGFDAVRAKMFHIEVVEINPNPSVADGQTPVTITLQVFNHKEQPVEGHILFGIAKNGGMFHAQRAETDADGIVVFTYYPFKVSSVRPLEDAELQFQDESNSVFIEIPTKKDVVITLTAPEEKKVDTSFLDGIFGE